MRSALVFSSCLSLFGAQSLASGLYSKGSPVLQVDSRTYEKLIAKSNYTSIVEFYAPWCGHCKNLKPAYEKAASSLSGYAKVAAIDCDDDSNKQFCGSMGVQGFPTLKIIKPSKKVGGRPIVEDYNGARTAKAISEVVTEKIPNHVARPKDAELDTWLQKTDRPKAIFFTERGVVSPLVKALAIDFLGSIDVAQIRSTEKEAAGKFKVESFPQAFVVPSIDGTPEKYDGALKKTPLKDFFSKFASPNPEFPLPTVQTKAKAKPTAKSKSSDVEPSCPAGHKGKNPHTPEVSGRQSKSSETPTPDAASESPATAPLEPEPTLPLESLDSEGALAQSCLNSKSGTCVLAIMLSSTGSDQSAVNGLREIAHKHYLRRTKLFPIYTVPSTNTAGQILLSKLGGMEAGEYNFVVLAINPKRRWWTRYVGLSMSQEAIEDWIDNIRFGDFKKEKLPEGIAVDIQDKEGKASKANAPPEDSSNRDEL